MKTYILFIFASFSDLEELEFFCFEHFPQLSIGSIKYVIESSGNCIIIFDSDKQKEPLVNSLDETLSLESIRFYMIFEKSSIFWSKLPTDLNNFIFKPQPKNLGIFKILAEMDKQPLESQFNLDEILEKIQIDGISSLSAEEKKFLDDFGN